MNDSGTRPGVKTEVRGFSVDANVRTPFVDDVATEEPLEIRLSCAGRMQSLAVTMRTPGNDFELAAGFLYAEGLLRERDDAVGIAYCIEPGVNDQQRYNVVTVQLHDEAMPDIEHMERHFTTTSACGVCGKAHIEALQTRAPRIASEMRVPFQTLAALPDRMRPVQRIFSATGGLHAAALFDTEGTLLVVREDVGRHNALDKAIGWALLNARLPLDRCVAVVSGRASYELVQKAIVAGIPVLCAISAPSSLAVSLAREFDLTLLAFLRGTRANVYTAPRRVTF
jgi:FdhD protein